MSGMKGTHDYGCTCKRHKKEPWDRPEHWSKEEVMYLEAVFGRRSDGYIASHLGRTVFGVRLKAKRLGLRKKDAGYTASELARQMGVDPSTVIKGWCVRGLAFSQIRQKTPYDPRRHRLTGGESGMKLIQTEDVEAFIRTRGWLINWEKVPADSPFYELVMENRWFNKAQLRRATGRDPWRLRGTKEGERLGLQWKHEGVHWYLPESEVARIPPWTPEKLQDSVFRYDQNLELRRRQRQARREERLAS